uniref:Uncharacterized protein n=1 Tax=Oryza punctata TaxID=4537 RepID=A0A0E0JVY4_ORYPU
MEGGGNHYDDGHLAELLELAAGGGGGAPLFPLFRSRTIGLAAMFIMWGASAIIVGAVPELAIPICHMLLSFAFLMAGVALLTLSVAAPRCAMAARAATTLENWLMALI